MLEETALAYINSSEIVIKSVWYGIFALGVFSASLSARSPAELERAPYFAYSSLVVLSICAVQAIYLLSIPAIIDGYVWLLVSTDLAAGFLGGFFIFKIAMARSRNAYGHARMAFLGLLPIAHFWLLFTPPRDKKSEKSVPDISVLSGGVGVLAGLAWVSAASMINVFLENRMDRLVEQAEGLSISPEAHVELLLRAHGLEATLQLLAAEAQYPVVVDNSTTLSHIEASGSRLNRVFITDFPDTTVSDNLHSAVTTNVCNTNTFQPLLRHGATIREIYTEQTGQILKTITVTRQECDF